LPDEVAAALVQEGEVVGGGAVDVQVAAMQVTVAAGAEGDEVLRGGRALLAIVGEVVNVQVELVGAAGALAAVAVAPQDVDALFWSEVAGAGVVPVGLVDLEVLAARRVFQGAMFRAERSAFSARTWVWRCWARWSC
jgi:hypothetical protein